MYARSTTVRGTPQRLDQAIAFTRDRVWPAIQGLPGCIGLSMLVDRDSGRCIATSSWESEEAMHESESPLHELRRRYAELLGGRPEVQEWEIAVIHRRRRAPEGAACRVIWSRADASLEEERLMDAVRMVVLPELDDVPGFCSVSMLIDRETSRAVTAAVYESREAMDAATAQVMQLREEFNREMGSEITEVAMFELALAHLRVPETV